MKPMERLLLDLFKAQGAADAAGLARKAAESFDLDQRDKKIYRMRTVERLSVPVIAERMEISESLTHRIIRFQMLLLRKAS